MILYRVAARRFAKDLPGAFSGEGSFRAGGRWSSVGMRMVYASTHLSLAALEVLAHCNERSFRDSRMSIRFEIPDFLVQRLPDQELPSGWDGIPEPVGTQSVGDAWILARSAVGLIVPTAALPGGTRLDERNVVLNPSFPNFLSHIRNASIEPFDFDARIASLVRA